MKQIKTAWTWREGQKWYRQPRVWVIVLLLLILGAVASVVVGWVWRTEEVTTEDPDSEFLASEAYQAAQAFQASIETYCEEQFTAYQATGAIAESIEVMNISNYQNTFALIKDAYDSQGRALYRFRWTAYDTATAGDVSVVCYLTSGGVDDHHLQQLKVDDVLVAGLEDFEVYDSDGILQR